MILIRNKYRAHIPLSRTEGQLNRAAGGIRERQGRKDIRKPQSLRKRDPEQEIGRAHV